MPTPIYPVTLQTAMRALVLSSLALLLLPTAPLAAGRCHSAAAASPGNAIPVYQYALWRKNPEDAVFWRKVGKKWLERWRREHLSAGGTVGLPDY